ncbi:unnamed protein product [Periconia digitata]|uniref:Uncharacterized protein n=1 Tax=Periconia digitata TaxID=1303443 RepID=A0A9W4UDM5_9PLEO|nr:unnamed protein product [Periconia digitata]
MAIIPELVSQSAHATTKNGANLLVFACIHMHAYMYVRDVIVCFRPPARF